MAAHAIGFAIVWTLIILSPTLVVPIATEPVAERRMYLPLAALAAVFVAGLYALVDGIAQQWSKKSRYMPTVLTVTI